jgi:hypothetical protein
LWWLAALATGPAPLSFPSDVLAAIIAAGFSVAGLRALMLAGRSVADA